MKHKSHKQHPLLQSLTYVQTEVSAAAFYLTDILIIKNQF